MDFARQHIAQEFDKQINWLIAEGRLSGECIRFPEEEKYFRIQCEKGRGYLKVRHFSDPKCTRQLVTCDEEGLPDEQCDGIYWFH